MSDTRRTDKATAVPFRQLQWKLTLSYMAVTFGTLLVATIIAAILIFNSLFASEDIMGFEEWHRLAREQIAPAMSPLLSQEPVDVATVDALLEGIETSVASREFLELGDTQLLARPAGQVEILVVDAAGKLVGAAGSSSSVESTSTETTTGQSFDLERIPDLEAQLDAALAGEAGSVADPQPGDDFLIVEPIYDLDQANSTVLGAVIIRFDSSLNRGGITAYILNVVGRSAVVFIIGAAILAAVFGALTAGGIIKRLSRLSAATYSWSQGDFSGLVADSSGDELSVLTDRMNIMAVQLQELLERRQEMAVTDERNRLARELHDSAKQQAFAASAQLGAALALYEQDPAQARGHILEAERLIGQVRSQLTDLILELRPAELQSGGLQGALEAYAQSWAQRNDIGLDFQVQGGGILSPESERTLFRITQEALANTARHGRASHVELHLKYERDGATLTITDDGRGFDPTVPSPGLGLRSMRERVQLLDGKITIDSAPGKGCTIMVSCPAGTSLVTAGRQDDEPLIV